MTEEERETLAEAIAHNQHMMQLYADIWEARSGGELGERSPTRRDFFRAGGQSNRLCRRLAAFAKAEADKGNLGPHFVAQQLEATAQTLTWAAFGKSLHDIQKETVPGATPKQDLPSAVPPKRREHLLHALMRADDERAKQ